MSIVGKLLRSGEGRKLKALRGLVPHINALEPSVQALSDGELAAKTPEFRARIANGEDLDDLLIEAFAVVREAAKRTIGQRHYDVQLMGGAALHLGWVAEMKTGEGKTLVSTLPAYLNGLAGKGVHIVTVNDYLASRDSEWMGQIHRRLGLSVGLVVPGEWDQQVKKDQYACDVTYGTNNEMGFDYLRDNMSLSLANQVQRGHNYCIVDEIDSILVDEARTPLIISGRVADAANTYYKFASVARRLERDNHYEVDEEKRTVAPTEEGVKVVEQTLEVENLYDVTHVSLVHHLGAALRAKELYQRDKEYILDSGEVKIVDEFTGRILAGRRWSDGLHQAIEAKEGVKIKEESQTLATVTLQNYFRLYEKLAGMTGTAQTEASELYGTYEMHVVPIPTHMPMVRNDRPDLVFGTEEGKFNAITEDIAERCEKGQPVLVGTISVEKSEKLSKFLNRRGVAHEVLNAKQHFREAEIISQAGRLHKVTVATNMAGRGVDIILGGNPESLARQDLLADGHDPDSEEFAKLYEKLLERYSEECEAEGEVIKELGGLCVVGTERHESRRIDNQLRGRSGRQGDPGESRFYLSLEDEMMRIFATGAVKWAMTRSLPEGVHLESKIVGKSVERAQNTVEQRNAETRKNVLRYDEVLNKQRQVIYKRRSQILAGETLREDALDYLESFVDSAVSDHCPEGEEWDIPGLHAAALNLWPTSLSEDDLKSAQSAEEMREMLCAEAVSYYEAREKEFTPELMREVERRLMLQVIDLQWRSHLYDMDYLKEGIHLRAMGQKNPLIEWQSEGFELFSKMMDRIKEDFVRMINHSRIDVTPAEGKEAEGVRNVQYSGNAASPNSTPQPAGGGGSAGGGSGGAGGAGSGNGAGAGNGADGRVGDGRGGVRPQPASVGARAAAVGGKTPRNALCPCNSGRKFKYCHGR